MAVYAERGKSPSRTITDGIVDPLGIAVDTNGTLYVTNLEPDDVQEYKAGQSQPYQTITDLNDTPADVIVNKAGYVYVSEIDLGGAVFKPGSTQPWHVFTQGMDTPNGIAYYIGTPP